jgi:hypothetical protein
MAWLGSGDPAYLEPVGEGLALDQRTRRIEFEGVVPVFVEFCWAGIAEWTD